MDMIREKNRGFTLIEAMLAVVILGIASAGILIPFSAGAAARIEGFQRTLGVTLASGLMEEIIATDYGDIISTYNGYSEGEGLVKDASGVVFSDSKYSNYSRAAVCEEVNFSERDGNGSAVFIRATVIVSYSDREIARVTRLISK